MDHIGRDRSQAALPQATEDAMGHFAVELRNFMQLDPVTVHAEERIHVAEARMREHGVSGLPVLDDNQRPVGVISRWDLLKLDTVPAVTGGGERKLMLPDHTVSRVMSRSVVSLPSHETLGAVAQAMETHHVHRVLIIDDGQLVGLVTAWDLVRRAADVRAACPIKALMTQAVVTVELDASVDEAIDTMRRSDVHGIIVVHDGWPVGVFAQAEALQAELFPKDASIEHWTSASLLTMPPNMPCHHAATQAVATGARYIVVVDDGGIRGLLTPANFAGLDRQPE